MFNDFDCGFIGLYGIITVIGLTAMLNELELFESNVIKSGKNWDGYVKNLRKDGKFYWVIVHIVPKYDDNKNIIGYIASRKVPERDKIAQMEKLYKKMREEES